MTEELVEARARIALLEEAVLWQHRLLQVDPEKPRPYCALILPSGHLIEVGKRATG